MNRELYDYTLATIRRLHELLRGIPLEQIPAKLVRDDVFECRCLVNEAHSRQLKLSQIEDTLDLSNSDRLRLDRALQAYSDDCRTMIEHDVEAEDYAVEMAEIDDLRNRIGVRE